MIKATVNIDYDEFRRMENEIETLRDFKIDLEFQLSCIKNQEKRNRPGVHRIFQERLVVINEYDYEMFSAAMDLMEKVESRKAIEAEANRELMKSIPKGIWGRVKCFIYRLDYRESLWINGHITANEM
jgi:hypothetical protein